MSLAFEIFASLALAAIAFLLLGIFAMLSRHDDHLKRIADVISAVARNSGHKV